MKDNILIVSALEVETQGQLEDWNVLHTGVGKVNATFSLTNKLSSLLDRRRSCSCEVTCDCPIVYNKPYDLIINYGTAGSRKYNKGELVDCTRFLQRDMDVTGLGFEQNQTPFEWEPEIVIREQNVKFNPIGKNAICGTGDSFVEDSSNHHGEVVDMEAYALAKVCYLYDVPFISFKYITDGADGNALVDWEENVGKGIVKFKEKVLDKLPKSL